MKKVLKYVLFALGIAGLLFALAVAGIIGFEKYEKVTWVPTELKGARLGMSRKDFLFTVEHLVCVANLREEEEDKTPLSSCEVFWIKSGPKKKDDEWVPNLGSAYLRGDVISKINIYYKNALRWEIPFANVEELTRHKGTPDILFVSTDFKGRSYTYVDDEITVTFAFQKNSLSGVYFGEMEIADTSYEDFDIIDGEWISKFGASEYTVNGRNLCPSSEAPTCPFDEAHEIKEEFKDLKPRDLL